MPVLVQPMMTQQILSSPVSQVQAVSSSPGTSVNEILNNIARDTHESLRSASTEAGQTTITLRNLPKTLGRNAFVDLLKREGFQGRFDFVYVPADYKHHVSFGYAFVNFCNGQAAEAARQYFDGFQWDLRSESSVLETSWSNPHQGYEVHVERYRNLEVKWIDHHNPDLVLFDAAEQEMQRIDLTRLTSIASMHKLMVLLGLDEICADAQQLQSPLHHQGSDQS